MLYPVYTFLRDFAVTDKEKKKPAFTKYLVIPTFFNIYRLRSGEIYIDYISFMIGNLCVLFIMGIVFLLFHK
ncbi:hypothetical protein ED312_10775 [Sinomicrobium pectinilyticum]|uniref:Uncharacterized protein n=1 Tax=Sinomicrobium pectinilyticum TaxID=1084421 RepID=A0A3N0EGX1_SINP1|nr:hypothetical protein ED312_10775 [Sinomicrobium pectinilyticum]